MLPLWGIVLGLAVGFLRRGRLAGLAELPLKGVGLVFAGLVVQLLIFPTPWWSTPPLQAGKAIWHVLSYGLIGAFFLWNWRVSALWLLALGMVLNLVVIAANGGYMPASLDALRAAGRHETAAALLASADHTYANVVLMSEGTRLNALGDWLFLPAWLPLANAFSPGDALLMLGVAWLIQAGMARARSAS